MNQEKYRLETTDLGYCLYDDEDYPVIVHAASPIINSRDSSYGSMNEKPVPEEVKTAIYLLDLSEKNRESGDNIRAKCYRKVVENELFESMTHAEKSMINTVWHSYTGESTSEEIEDFVHWCIETCDSADVADLNMMADALHREVKEDIEGEDDET